MSETPRCEVCGSQTHPDELREAEIIGRRRTVCGDCHSHLEGVW